MKTDHFSIPMHNLERNLHLQMALSFTLSEYRVMLAEDLYLEKLSYMRKYFVDNYCAL